MSDAWNILDEDVHKYSEGRIHPRKMSGYGMYCFKMEKIHPFKQIVNNYKNSSDQYCALAEKEKGKETKYNMNTVDLRVFYWKDSILKGKLVRVEMTHRVLVDIAEKRLKLKEYGLNAPDIILYWKPNRLTVKFTFITEEEFNEVELGLKEGNYDEVAKQFFWLGRKERVKELDYVRRYGYKE